MLKAEQIVDCLKESEINTDYALITGLAALVLQDVIKRMPKDETIRTLVSLEEYHRLSGSEWDNPRDSRPVQLEQGGLGLTATYSTGIVSPIGPENFDNLYNKGKYGYAIDGLWVVHKQILEPRYLRAGLIY